MLGEWSALIQLDYDTCVLQEKAGVEASEKLLGTIFKLAAETSKDVQEIKANQRVILLEYASLKASNPELQNQMIVLKGKVALINIKLSKFATPPPRSRMEPPDELIHPLPFKNLATNPGLLMAHTFLMLLMLREERGPLWQLPLVPTMR